jgi:hypothetical protein
MLINQRTHCTYSIVQVVGCSNIERHFKLKDMGKSDVFDIDEKSAVSEAASCRD